jgi:hypothetical protein
MRSGLLVFLLLPGVCAADELYVIPDGVETRWASPENPTGERGHGGEANGGRKGAAFFVLQAGESRTLAEVRVGSGVVRRLWITLNDLPRLGPVADRLRGL